MSKRSQKAKQRLRAQNRAAWLDLPRRLSRYEAFLMLLAGIVFLGVAQQELSGRGADANTAGTWKSGTAQTMPGSEASHTIFGALFGITSLTLIVAGSVGLLGKKR